MAAAAPSLPPAPTLTAESPTCANPARVAAPSNERVEASFSGADMETKAPVKTCDHGVREQAKSRQVKPRRGEARPG